MWASIMAASLNDPDRILEGSGKELRHVKVRDLAAARSEPLVSLLREAIDERKPYAAES